MKTEIEDVAVCSFCGRGSGKVSLLIRSLLRNVLTGQQSESSICQDCAQTTLYTFLRIDELKADADELSMVAAKKFGKKDPDGNCTCPKCLLATIMETDPILRGIEKAAARLRAEEIHSGNTMH